MEGVGIEAGLSGGRSCQHDMPGAGTHVQGLGVAGEVQRHGLGESGGPGGGTCAVFAQEESGGTQMGRPATGEQAGGAVKGHGEVVGGLLGLGRGLQNKAGQRATGCELHLAHLGAGSGGRALGLYGQGRGGETGLELQGSSLVLPAARPAGIQSGLPGERLPVQGIGAWPLGQPGGEPVQVGDGGAQGALSGGGAECAIDLCRGAGQCQGKSARHVRRGRGVAGMALQGGAECAHVEGRKIEYLAVPAALHGHGVERELAVCCTAGCAAAAVRGQPCLEGDGGLGRGGGSGGAVCLDRAADWRSCEMAVEQGGVEMADGQGAQPAGPGAVASMSLDLPLGDLHGQAGHVEGAGTVLHEGVEPVEREESPVPGAAALVGDLGLELPVRGAECAQHAGGGGGGAGPAGGGGTAGEGLEIQQALQPGAWCGRPESLQIQCLPLGLGAGDGLGLPGEKARAQVELGRHVRGSRAGT